MRWLRLVVVLSLFASLPMIVGSGDEAVAAGYFSGEPGSIVTLAGGRNGDGLPAQEASLYPAGVAVGPDGLVYVSDFWHHRVRRIAADGTIEPFAGDYDRHRRGNGGDGRSALEAGFGGPSGLTFDTEGSLYVADYQNHQVDKITPEGIVTRVAGTGRRGFGGDGGPARQAALSGPLDVAVDSDGNVFIADQENSRVRRVDAETGEIETYAGGGPLYEEGAKATDVSLGVWALAIDAANDDLYVFGGCRVRRVDAQTQAVSSVVGGGPGGGCGFSGDGGPASEAQLGNGIYVGLDITSDGRLWIADAYNKRVRVVGPDGIIRTFAGNGTFTGALGDGGPAADATLQYVRATAMDASGNLYIATEQSTTSSGDGAKHDRVRVVGPDGTIQTYAGNGTGRATPSSGGRAIGAGFGYVHGLAWDEHDRLYIAASSRNAANGGNFPGGHLWRLDPDGRLHKVAGNGALEALGTPDETGPALAVPIYPLGIDVGPDGRVYFADGEAWQIKAFDPVAQTIEVVAGKKIQNPSTAPVAMSEPADRAELINPVSVSVDDNGAVYFAEGDHVLPAEMGRVRRVRDGLVELVAGLPGGQDVGGFNGDGLSPTETMLYGPWGVEALPGGDVLIAEVLNRRVRLLDVETGTMSTVAGDGGEDSRVGTIGELSSFHYPRDVESDGQGGFFVADAHYVFSSWNHTRIVHVSASGMSDYVAGTGVHDFSGDGPALAQALLEPRALALGDHGLAVADYDRVRLLIPPEEGWPNPVREPVCLPNAPDVPGDTETETVSLHNPSFDIRGTEVRTIGEDLEVTIELEDLDAATMWAPDATEQWPGWVYQIWAGTERGADRVVGTSIVYLGAFATASVDDLAGAKPGAFVFEVGELTGSAGIDPQEGRERIMSMRRLAPAEGSVDFDADTVTIRAPLASLGFELGEHTFRQYGIAGKVLQLPQAGIFSARRQLQYYDTTSIEARWRTIVFGRNCPDAWV